ncbi:cytochrome C [Halarcobacter ebronensis]|uniref:Cytochrome C n=1 Tax=Halarcobacter ebronensis TaxID=1462615 RepID=A0A4Q0YKZ7_9BACT|nr:cytochrome c3 family protein [Halarcobacter ebronensis]RXJ69801.1 cytochrome C [Halarcobacter ebronensis]
MKTKKTLILTGFFLIFSAILLFGNSIETIPGQIVVNPEVKKKFPIKSHHAELSFNCVHCHEGQGDDPEKFKTPGDEGCLSCHKDKQYLANRLKFMDPLKFSPHNSIHDGPTLYCDECHNEHKPSINMCSECHEHEINDKLWMKATP